MSHNCRRLVGKVAIVTASTEGIGFAIAQRLAEEGAKVVISSRKQANVDRATQELKSKGHDVIGVPCHASHKEQRQNLIDETIKAFGGIDIVVSNAATNPHMGSILETDERMYDKIMELNVKSTFFLVKEVVPYMEKRGGGSVVLVSSVGGFQPNEIIGIYGMSKTAILGLNKALAPQLASMNIRVNTLAPGLIKTKMSTGLWSNDTILDMALQTTPMRRIGLPDEMAGCVAFMVSEDASYMTGETICVSGGLPARL